MGEPIKVLVCGGRDYANRANVFAALDECHAQPGVAAVIEGGALGADRLAREWAKARGVPLRTFVARWDLDGRAAGPIRNSQMLREGQPDLVLAFPGGRGTADMVAKAKRAGVTTVNCADAPAPAILFGHDGTTGGTDDPNG